MGESYISLALFSFILDNGVYVPVDIHAVWFIRDTVIFRLEMSLKCVRIQSSSVPYFVP